MVKPFLEGRSLQEAMELNKIYIINYKHLLDVTCTDCRKVIAIPKISLSHAMQQNRKQQEKELI